MAEGAPLLREYAPKVHRGFESHCLRQYKPFFGVIKPMFELCNILTHRELITNRNMTKGLFCF